MEYENKLVDFIDGELPEEEERELFSMISMDDSLRGEYKSLLAITNTIKASAGIYSPSTELKASVYSDLNISLPVKHAPAFAKFMQGTKWHLFSGGIGALLATSVFMISTNFFSSDNNQSKPSIINQPALVQQYASQKAEPKIDKFSIGNNNQNFINNDNNINHNSTMETIPDENNPTLLAMSEPMYSTRKYFRAAENIKFGNLDNSDIYRESDNHNIQKDDAKGISIEAGWSLNWNLPKETIQPAKMNEFNNLGASVFYDITENISIGVDIRQETFYTEYIGKEPNDTIYLYQQNSNLTTFSTSSRFYPFEQDKFNPFLGILIGINSGGFAIRPNIGLVYKRYSDLAFVFGLEYCYYRYKHQDNWFGASKVGINCGINMKF